MLKKSILYPTDFSKCADNALIYAIAVAKAFKCEIHLVHAMDSSEIIGIEPNTASLINELDAYKRTAVENLKKRIKKIKQYNIDCTYEVNSILGSNWLSDYINSTKPKMIVMGTIGSGSFKNKIIGSLTYKTVTRIKIPVFVIPLEANFKGLKQMIFATDFMKDDLQSLDILTSLARHFKSSIDIAHISTEQTSEKKEEELLQRLKVRAKEKLKYRKLSFQLLLWENVEERLAILLKESKAQLLGIVPRKRGILEKIFDPGVTKKMIYHSKVPILVFN